MKDWLYALPLLHFLRGDSEPSGTPKYEKNIRYDEWKWWGLEDITVREFLPRMSYRFDVYSYFMKEPIVVG